MWLLNLQCEQTRSRETSRGQAVYKTDKTADTRTIQTGEEKGCKCATNAEDAHSNAQTHTA